MTLLTARNLSLHYGATAILDDVNLSIEPGERICLLGRNGEGKSTLLNVLSGAIAADDGEIRAASTLRIATLQQDVPSDIVGRVYDIIARGLGTLGATLSDYHRLLEHEPDSLTRIGALHDKIDTLDGWNADNRIHSVASRLGLDAQAQFEDLSGGLKRRVLLAAALVVDPDLLFLDEPTNHLDVESIDWLEQFLTGWHGALLFVTHDRAFLRRLATRIVELDRGVISSWPGDYENFLRRKQDMLDAEEQARAKFDRKLAQEEVWIRQGIQARRTRNEGRVRALEKLRDQFRHRREQSGTANIRMQDSERSAKLISRVKDLSFAWGGLQIVDGLSTDFQRGDRVGIIGPNGIGKTTLLNLILGKLEPQAGNVRVGKRLQVAYFDQLRDSLDDNVRVCEAVGEGSDFVDFNKSKKHVLGYLQEFLFTPDRARQPVRSLSGGERSRLLLAKLFTQPCNVLVMDEPTNDLDLETLDLLEERLLEFAGTVFIVSHDREFLNRVVTRTLAFEGNGRVGDYVGGYDDWVRQRAASNAAKDASDRQPTKTGDSAQSTAKRSAAGRPVKQKPALSQPERRELERLPAQLEALESRQAEIGLALSAPEIYQENPDQARALQNELDGLNRDIASAFERWEALEAKRRT